MPTIRRQPERVFLESTNPQLQSVEQAGFRGRALSQFGQDVQGFASDLAAYQKAKNQNDRSLYDNMAKVQGDLAAQDIENEILLSKDLSPDGSDYASEFDRRSQESLDTFLDSVPDNHRFRASDVFRSQMIAKRDSILQQSRKKHLEFTGDNIDEQASLRALNAFKDPDRAFEQEAEHLIFLESQKNFLGNTKPKVVKEHQSKILDAQVSGYLEQRRYKEAKKALLEPTTSSFLNADDRRKKIQELEEKKYSQFEKDIRLNDLLNKQVEQQQEQYEDKKRLEVLNKASAADDFGDIEALQDTALDLTATGAVRPRFYDDIKKITDPVGGGISDKKETELLKRILLGENVTGEIQSSLGVTLSKEAVNRLTSTIRMRNVQKKDPEWAFEEKTAMRIISPPKGLLEITSAPREERENLMRKRYQLLVYQKGMRPVPAAEQARREVMDLRNLEFVPGVDVSLQRKDPDAAAKKLTEDFSKIQKPTKEQIEAYKNGIHLLELRKESMEIFEREKSGG